MKIRKLLALGVVFGCGVQFASAQAYNLDLFFTQAYMQTGPSTSAFQAYYAAERIDSVGTIFDPTSATVTRPNPPGTVDTLTSTGLGELQYSSPTYTSLSDFTTDFPTGTYSFSGDGGLYMGSVDNPGSLWAPTPTLATNFAALTGGLAPNTAFTVDFNPFTADTGSNSATTFIGLYNETMGGMFVDGTALSASATSWTIAASDLAPNDSYLLVLDDDNRFNTSGSQPFFQGAGTILSWDTNQDIYFQTVPEPGAFAVVGVGVLGLLLRRRR